MSFSKRTVKQQSFSLMTSLEAFVLQQVYLTIHATCCLLEDPIMLKIDTSTRKADLCDMNLSTLPIILVFAGELNVLELV